MRLTEAEGKALLRRHGIAVPRGVLLSALGDAPPPPEVANCSGLVLKAQLVEGGRGKRGLVRRVAPNELAAAHRAMAAIASDAGFLLEEAVDVNRELYLALRLDGTQQGIELLLATEGGVEVEQTSALLRLPLDPEVPGAAETVFHALRGRLPPDLAARLAREAVRLARVMIEEDLELLEINPLAITGEGRLVACDAKLVRDDAATFRHDAAAMAESARLEERALTPLERRARQQGFSGRMPAAAATCFHRGTSSRSRSASGPGPSSGRRAPDSSIRRASSVPSRSGATSRASFSTTSGGVPRGASIAYQITIA
jgi:succinyl-CoA synthetase beta subunit